MFPFNKQLWDIGREIEDKTLPMINSRYECDFKRNDNDIYDILDFKDEEKKVIVEIKGRRNTHDKYEETIITASKITAGLQKIDMGYRVFLIFVFTDKIFEYELKEDTSFNCKFTGTNCIQHYLIPVKDMTEIEAPLEEPCAE